MCHKMNSFYTEMIKINYEDLGFIQLINPTNHKFKPPIDETINQELGIMTLNTLFNEGSWNSFSHMEILYGNLIISATTVIRDLVTNYNFHLKKFYFTQMLRCRFLEVLIIYNTSLTALMRICRNKNNLNEYVKCVLYLFVAINDTVKMFDFMLTIIEKLRLSNLWLPERLSSNLLAIYKLIYNYVIDLKTNNVVRDMFINKPEVNIEHLSNDYTLSFQKARYKFSNILSKLKKQNKNMCYSNDFMIIKKDLDTKFCNNAIIISKYLYDFYENFVKTDYEDTGFNKIHQNYFWKWV
ncbi:uncharacterized protein LOC126908545 [Daktulosphaira vitifoliae]|uniref:uncharacterized protein LOC126908545 n=1 Tax=Daktulosphaira vitifoliae TaxID=58002 RepID=UPI0021A9E6F3|nr:uncharacterized protein LOC126908545 [Daktulosphaira vitifoliae]